MLQAPSGRVFFTLPTALQTVPLFKSFQLNYLSGSLFPAGTLTYTACCQDPVTAILPVPPWDPLLRPKLTGPSEIDLLFSQILPQASEILLSPTSFLQAKLSFFVFSSHFPLCPSLSRHHQNLKADPAALPRTMLTQAPAPPRPGFGTKHPGHDMCFCRELRGPQWSAQPWGQSSHPMPQSSPYHISDDTASETRVNPFFMALSPRFLGMFPDSHEWGECAFPTVMVTAHKVSQKVSTDMAQRKRETVSGQTRAVMGVGVTSPLPTS